MVKIEIFLGQGSTKSRSDCKGQANIILGQLRIKVQWPGGQVELGNLKTLTPGSTDYLHVWTGLQTTPIGAFIDHPQNKI